MIQIITGKLGAGKTLYSVMSLFELLCLGRTVCTNIAIDWSECCALARSKHRVILNPDQYIKLDPGIDRNWHEKIPFGVSGSFVEVFLDEIHLFFNARDWARTNSENKSLLSFLTQSRKARVNVTFICQEITTLEKQFRVLAEWELYVVSSDHIPLGGLEKLPIKFFIVSQRDAQNSIMIKKRFKSYSKTYFKLYGSFTFLDAEMNALARNALHVDQFKLEKIGYLNALKEDFQKIYRIVFFPVFNLVRKLMVHN